jgi:hypothetical protein
VWGVFADAFAMTPDIDTWIDGQLIPALRAGRIDPIAALRQD